MQVDLTENEIYQIIDAIRVYHTNYAITGAVEKTLKGAESKLLKIIRSK